MTDSIESRREFPRIDHRMVARFEVNGQKHRGTVLNLSEAGLFINTTALFEPGDQIEFELGSGKTMSLEGEVVWFRKGHEEKGIIWPSGMGIHLSAVPGEYIVLVQKLLVKKDPERRIVEERFEMFHRVQFKSGASFLTEYTENLSKGGMYLSTNRDLKSGEVIQAKLEIPGLDEPITVEGKVAYRLSGKEAEDRGRGKGVGVQFVNLSSKTKAILGQYLTRLEVHRSSPDRRRTGGVPDEGSLSEYLVAEVLFYLARGKRTGRLGLVHGEQKKIVFFKNGQPIAVQSNLRGEALGDYLLREGKISEEQLLESLKDLPSSGMQHGELLVTKGFVSGAEMASVLVAHQQDKVENTFPWFEGTYKFIEGADWPENLSILPLNLFQIIQKGIGRWFDAPLVQAWMGITPASRLKKTSSPDSDLQVSSQALRLLNLCSKPRKIQDLADSTAVKPESLLKMAFLLIIAGWAQLDFSKPKKESPIKEKIPKMPKAEGFSISGFELRVKKDLERFRTMGFYEIMKFTPSSSRHDLDKAYEELMTHYPEEIIDILLDPELRTMAQQISSWIRLAYETLKDPDLRRLYSSRGSKKKQVVGLAARMEAERKLLMGLKELREKNYEAAVDLFSEASRAFPDDPTFEGYLAWAKFERNPDSYLQMSTAVIEKALKASSSDPYLYFFKGQIAAHLGNWSDAEASYSKALKLYPQFLDAELNLEKAKDQIIALRRVEKSTNRP